MKPTLLCILFAALNLAAGPLSVTDFGAEPGSGKDASEAIRKALAACEGKEAPVLVFPKGRYDFYPHENPWAFRGLTINNHKNLTIDGQGSRFIFHGVMGIGLIQNSHNITLRNFTADWDIPLIAQGEIIDTQKEWVDIRFDSRRHPFEITHGKLFFLGESWRRQISGYTLLFDRRTHEILPNTLDHSLGPNTLFTTRAEALGEGLVRFHGRTRMQPEPGTLIALWLGTYIIPGFDLQRSKNITLENIDLHHALSHGVVGFRTENITLRNINFRPDPEKGRVFSLVADGFHIATCKGLVTIENCLQAGVGDDFLNLHGTHLLIRERLNATTLKTATTGKGGNTASFAPGDDVWFICAATAQRIGSARLLTSQAGTLTFDSPIPPGIGEGDFLENKTWNASLEMRGCTITRKNRARGILVTTPCRALIEKNTFRSAGAAILIEGDTNYWYESGAIGDLTIRDNTFEDCFTSPWGQAVITLSPSFTPQSDADEAYHRNIRIENNTFHTFAPPILFARSVRNLTFTGNTLTRTHTFSPSPNRNTMFFLDGCRNAFIGNNRYLGDVPGKNLKTKNMNPADLTLADAAIHIEKE